MATEILKSYSSLQDELDQAKDNLKGVEDHIKKLIGRDPNDPLSARPGQKRPVNQSEDPRGRGRGSGASFPPPASRTQWDPRGDPRGDLRGDLRGDPRDDPRRWQHDGEDDGPPAFKRRMGETRTVFSRLSGPPRPSRDGDSGDEGELPNKPSIQSRVYATPKEQPTRQDAMAAQNKDERSKARNRRMFGALLGTLQKFRQEETQMKVKEEKRAIVERKLEDNAKREREELKRKRIELFVDRKQKQAEIKKIELKLLRIKEQDEWEMKNRNLLNFIQTRSKPHIFYLPRVHNMKTEERLVASQKIVAKMIERKRENVQMELQVIEKRGRWRPGGREPTGGNRNARHGSEDGHGGDPDNQAEQMVDKENRMELGVSVKEEKGAEVTESGKDDCRASVKDEDDIDLEASGIILGEVDEIEGDEDEPMPLETGVESEPSRTEPVKEEGAPVVNGVGGETARKQVEETKVEHFGGEIDEEQEIGEVERKQEVGKVEGKQEVEKVVENEGMVVKEGEVDATGVQSPATVTEN